MNFNFRKFLVQAGQITVGNAISAFSIACFALPYGMVVSGISGFGRIANYYFGFNISATVLIINIALFLLGWAMLGTKFAMSIIVGSLTFPAFLELFQSIPQLQHLVDDPLLAAICAGIIDGVGLGIVIRSGGSTGGIDVPPIILNRKFGMKVAPLMYALDMGIFLIQLPITKTNGIILGILYAFLYSIVMNKVIVMDQGGMQMFIFSSQITKINERLLELGFGTTLFNGTGGYLREPQEICYCVVSSRNLNRVKREVLAIDKTAFISISNASEVNGNGFTLLLRDEGYLMHTLPASVHSLVWAKLIVSLVWLLATNLVIVLLGGLSVMHLAQMNLAQLLAGFPSMEELRRMLASVGLNMGDFYLVLAELALIIILSGLVSCLHFYAAMSLGHTFTRRKGLMSVLCFVGISFAFSLITNLLGIQEVEYLNTVTVVSIRGGLNVLHGTMGKSFFYLLAQGALLYAATVFGLQKKLNLA